MIGPIVNDITVRQSGLMALPVTGDSPDVGERRRQNTH